jgi:uncharacterized lipoprotein YmbA
MKRIVTIAALALVLTGCAATPAPHANAVSAAAHLTLLHACEKSRFAVDYPQASEVSAGTRLLLHDKSDASIKKYCEAKLAAKGE